VTAHAYSFLEQVFNGIFCFKNIDFLYSKLIVNLFKNSDYANTNKTQNPKTYSVFGAYATIKKKHTKFKLILCH
jgi:hypothetical protein